ncbi:MAG TPA: glycerol-3-phosphate dehydrogenase [Elusimicrobia bacterium]|nr:MAG: glycerol-3-phosphate dehydrogenase [Elusimicrobia bacterium RIFOXYA12_FULL_49_49]OGS10074.1 MAG: glycerol-3-phosphate dehydrogenase [Elusimicrobia bacterium RIFOXYA1_FULL_47_7]OGS15302.1 MAG: glycerol-3-phosphate dehydrogenase [Elusimicrobia bacterium RIFOXYA2_FULL_47_53]OGS26544.1 MAG: glycerol-3-phosphate dehydrogenase [Elusimicrobia bacterium RIFOXYB12_FULL_50_12]OGS30557.1 MAG: glycerol-3-phosphate dehydrogenase [Elusimicrobia bacterium RIFOXYB2_FULL_46_23]HBU68979.1 glycerol-3-pho
MTLKIGVLGAGSWGTTIANLLFEKGCSVTLWEFDEKKARELAMFRSLSFFPYITLSKELIITSDISSAVKNMDFVVFVVPSHTLRATAKKVSACGADLKNTVIVSATKGIENTTLKRMSEILEEELGSGTKGVAVLSGPTHAEEVAKKIPTAATAASKNEAAARAAQELFLCDYFRVYSSPDIAGVETGAALKNVLAIAAGICDGLALGDNTKAALVTRGLREIAALGIKMGGNPSTFFGLSGLGDLIVTAFSKHSRNRGLGEKIGAGKTLSESEKEIIMVAEGVKTSKSAVELAKKYSIQLPIIEQVYRILYENKSPREALMELMSREAKSETVLEIGRLCI